MDFFIALFFTKGSFAFSLGKIYVLCLTIMQVSTLLGQKWEVLSPTPYPHPLLTPTPSKNSLARTCLTSEWYNKAVDKFLFWNMIGKHNFQCVWMAEDQSCPERAKPQRIGCSVLCSTLNMKFQAIAIKRCLRSKKKNIYYIKREQQAN